MAGSLRAFIYISDQGNKYVVRLDESTYEDAELGFVNNGSGGSNLVPIIRGIPLKMRYINCYRDEDGVTVRRKFYIGKPDASIYINGGSLQLQAAGSGDVVEGGNPWIVSSSRGEKRSFIGLADTNQLDSDEDGPPIADPAPAA